MVLHKRPGSRAAATRDDMTETRSSSKAPASADRWPDTDEKFHEIFISYPESLTSKSMYEANPAEQTSSAVHTRDRTAPNGGHPTTYINLLEGVSQKNSNVVVVDWNTQATKSRVCEILETPSNA